MMNDMILFGQGFLFWFLVGLVLVCLFAVWGIFADWWDDEDDDDTTWGSWW